MKNCTGERCPMQYDKVDPATCELVASCPLATPPRTNGDYTRAMSDKELAEWIAGSVLNLTGGSLKMATEAWLDWLKQEAKE